MLHALSAAQFASVSLLPCRCMHMEDQLLTRRQGLLQLVRLVDVCHAQRVQVLGAADLELGHALLALLDLDGLGVLPACCTYEGVETFLSIFSHLQTHASTRTPPLCEPQPPPILTSQKELLNLVDLLGLQGAKEAAAWVGNIVSAQRCSTSNAHAPSCSSTSELRGRTMRGTRLKSSLTGNTHDYPLSRPLAHHQDFVVTAFYLKQALNSILGHVHGTACTPELARRSMQEEARCRYSSQENGVYNVACTCILVLEFVHLIVPCLPVAYFTQVHRSMFCMRHAPASQSNNLSCL